MTEKEVLYCAMLRLACYTEDFQKGRPINGIKPCEICRIEPSLCRELPHKGIIELAESVGILISPLINRAGEYQVHLEK